MTAPAAKADVLAKLREPFPASAVNKLPRATKKDNPKGKCEVCKGWHGLPAVHLDYVGHAEVTDRLLSADPEWNWEPFALDDRGLPLFVRDGQGRPVGLWIRLTVGGVTRPGFGSVEPGCFDAEKQLIGDALRNASMRFGVALDLWAKGDLESQRAGLDAGPAAAPTAPQDDPGQNEAASAAPPPAALEDAYHALMQALPGLEPAQAKEFQAWRRAQGWPMPPASPDVAAAMLAKARELLAPTGASKASVPMAEEGASLFGASAGVEGTPGPRENGPGVDLPPIGAKAAQTLHKDVSRVGVANKFDQVRLALEASDGRTEHYSELTAPEAADLLMRAEALVNARVGEVMA